MLINLNRSGGFAAVPGLGRKLSVDTSSLPKNEAEQLESAARAVLSGRQPPEPTPPTAGDRYTYHLTVQEGSASHSLTVTEPFEDPAMDTLIDLLSSCS
ncbi:hypothetical protein LWF15_17900 [Kineosporia rhizophila]|uniref:protealysin inhibitor emfourin n=1 Tax=Kineosporia rhizophila TaxID=84633 RepID=UPI000B2D453F|nr:protealysin inhibitor emfourin [Kineosporia rhizophila]MCE0537380.1 hypothetical protein [Kineosporia rhizophila]